jgi:hypothetical protein
MERRAREPVAMLTCREFIRCDAVLEFLTFASKVEFSPGGIASGAGGR